MQYPILYSFRRCPYAMRARLALAVSGTPVELREVKLSAKPEALLAASPKGTVPVLILLDRRVVDQSIDIMSWALSNNDPEGWGERDDPDLIATNDGPFKQDLDRYKYPERYGSDALTHRERVMTFLRELERRLIDAKHLAGDRRGLVDAAIFPFVRQCVAVDPAWFAEQALPRLMQWLKEHRQSRLFEAIMVRATPWTPGDAQLVLDWSAAVPAS